MPTLVHLSICKECQVVSIQQCLHWLCEQAVVYFVGPPKLAKASVEGKLCAVDIAGQSGGHQLPTWLVCALERSGTNIHPVGL